MTRQHACLKRKRGVRCTRASAPARTLLCGNTCQPSDMRVNCLPASQTGAPERGIGPGTAVRHCNGKATDALQCVNPAPAQRYSAEAADIGPSLFHDHPNQPVRPRWQQLVAVEQQPAGSWKLAFSDSTRTLTPQSAAAALPRRRPTAVECWNSCMKLVTNKADAAPVALPTSAHGRCSVHVTKIVFMCRHRFKPSHATPGPVQELQHIVSCFVPLVWTDIVQTEAHRQAQGIELQCGREADGWRGMLRTTAIMQPHDGSALDRRPNLLGLPR